ncbi:MAG TPA: nucleotidyltransferase domain-containing protein [Fimbriimonadaceae bacterium]|jgi:predicted nucleotidyltransferase
MNEPISLPNRYLTAVRSIFDRHRTSLDGIKVYLVGSRASGNAKEFSDIDLLLETSTTLSFLQMGLLRSDFEESDLPISVDLLDANSLTPEFHELVKTRAIQIWPEA